MSSPAVANVLQQLAASDGFLGSMTGTGLCDALMTTNIESMARSIAAQVGCIRNLQVTDATALNSAVAATSFPNNCKAVIASAVSAATMQCARANAQTQTLRVPYKLFTQTDVDGFGRDGNTRGQIIASVTDRCRLVNILWLAEKPTLGPVSAYVAAWLGPNTAPSPIEMRALTKDIKTSL